MSHVRSCMPTCICPFLAVYAEAILEGLGLARSQLSTSEGWGASCNRQNIARQLLTLFCGTYYRCCQVMSGNDSYFDIYKKIFYTFMHHNQGGALVRDGTNLKQWYRIGRNSEKLVQSRQISSMAAILNVLLNLSKSDN